MVRKITEKLTVTQKELQDELKAVGTALTQRITAMNCTGIISVPTPHTKLKNSSEAQR